MRKINRVILHCSATNEGDDVTAAMIKRWHADRGWSDIGYHYIGGLDQRGRPKNTMTQQQRQMCLAIQSQLH